MRSRARRLGPVVAFIAGAALAFPLATRAGAPLCSRTGATGAFLKLGLVSATRDGVPVAVETDLTAYIQNTKSSDASRLDAVLVDIGDTPSSTPTLPRLTIRRLP